MTELIILKVPEDIAVRARQIAVTVAQPVEQLLLNHLKTLAAPLPVLPSDTQAVDTNILLDVLIPAAPFGAASQQSLDTALQQGTLVLNEIDCAHGTGDTTARIFRNFAYWRACKA